MKMRRLVFALILVITILGTLPLPSNAIIGSTSNHPFLTFIWTHHGENYTGMVVSMSETLRLDEARISLYDMNKELRETGLLSQYGENYDFGQYLRFSDVNQNGKLDAADMFIIYNANVTEDWGIVFTYEPTGSTLSSRTLSNNVFTVKKHEKKLPNLLNIIYDPYVPLFILEISISCLILILVYINTRKN